MLYIKPSKGKHKEIRELKSLSPLQNTDSTYFVERALKKFQDSNKISEN